MKIGICIASGDAVDRRAVRRASRALLLAACVAGAVCVLGGGLVLKDARTVLARNAFLAERTAKLLNEARSASGDPRWKELREKGTFFSSGLRAGGPGVVETMGVLESALPAEVVVRQVQISGSGAFAADGASTALGGGAQFRKALEGTESRWSLSLESLGYDQSRREYGFRMKGAWRPR